MFYGSMQTSKLRQGQSKWSATIYSVNARRPPKRPDTKARTPALRGVRSKQGCFVSVALQTELIGPRPGDCSGLGVWASLGLPSVCLWGDYFGGPAFSMKTSFKKMKTGMDL